MRSVDRRAVAVPESLRRGGRGEAELRKARDHRADASPDKKVFSYTAYKEADVRLALEELFHGKCAYCETPYSASAPVDIEHYRPKGAVAEDPAHGGYWWVAMDWDNLLPSCIDCNRLRSQILLDGASNLASLAASARMGAGKKDSFPLADGAVRSLAEQTDFTGEAALLLNPCDDDPARHLVYNFDPVRPLGLILPSGNERQRRRAMASIQIYGLNRLRLVQERTEVLRRVEFLVTIAIDLSGAIAELEEGLVATGPGRSTVSGVARRLRLLRDRLLDEVRLMGADEAPYAAMVRAWRKNFRERLDV